MAIPTGLLLSPDYWEVLLKDLPSSIHLLWSRLVDILQWVLPSKRLILMLTIGMVGQELQTLDVLIATEALSKSMERLGLIAIAWYKHIAHAHGLPHLSELLRRSKCIRVGLSRQATMPFG